MLTHSEISIRFPVMRREQEVAQNIVDRWNKSGVVWKEVTALCGENRHSTATSKPHPNCKVWWREHHGLGLLCYLRARTACYHRRKTEFTSLSRQFAGECTTICPPIEAQQKLGDATGQRPKTEEYQSILLHSEQCEVKFNMCCIEYKCEYQWQVLCSTCT